jgi:acyl-CoA synthetase (AMP-forming)/AMP-acid ligase II
MARAEAPSLRRRAAHHSAERFFFDRFASARFTSLASATSLGGRLGDLAGRSVLLAASSQLTAALALIELDGVARRITILPPDVAPDHLAALIRGAEIDAVVTDLDPPPEALRGIPIRVACAPTLATACDLPAAFAQTEWVMLTSGTTGVPKMVVHDLAGLTAAFVARKPEAGVIWGTYYDIRRYGGLQIFLRAVLGGTSLILSSPGEPVSEHLERLARHGVTHLLGTPTHWRRALMSPEIKKIAPRYVRLSGEIADQTILDALRATFPQAIVSHAFASTEAGVAFEVRDGLAGFPARWIGQARGGVEMKVKNGSLCIRSPRTASRYVGTDMALRDEGGFVDTGDMVELRGDRYVFAGRRGGIINVGGLKVHPEEIEAVINRHPQVRMSLVRGKRSPVTGALVIADVVLKSSGESNDSASRQIGARDHALVEGDILKLCRDALPRHKVPAAISIVPSLDVAATGKLARRES